MQGCILRDLARLQQQVASGIQVAAPDQHIGAIREHLQQYRCVLQLLEQQCRCAQIDQRGVPVALGDSNLRARVHQVRQPLAMPLRAEQRDSCLNFLSGHIKFADESILASRIIQSSRMGSGQLVFARQRLSALKKRQRDIVLAQSRVDRTQPK